MRRSLGLRLVLAALVWGALALAVAGAVIGVLLRDFVERSLDAVLDATMTTLIAETEIDALGYPVLVAAPSDARFALPLSGWYWQIAASDAVLLRSPSLFQADLGAGAAPPDGQVHADRVAGPGGQPLRRLWRDFTAPGGEEPLRVSVTLPQRVVAEEVAAVRRPLLLSLALLGLGLVLAIAVQVRVGLAPLRRLVADVAAVRQGKAEGLPPRRDAELAPLVREMNDLLADNRAVIERARTHVGNLAHALKTQLSVLANSPDAATAQAMVARMDGMIGYHLRRARGAGAGLTVAARTPVAGVLDDLALVLRGACAARGLTLAVEAAPQAVFAGERQDAEEMLGTLMENATKWAATRIAVRAGVEGGRLVVTVDDDGPGIAPDARAFVLGRGARLDEGTPGQGLGLPIAADLAALYGGSLGLEASPLGGLRARLVLPAPV
jgi:signal transduction histidine kinase